MLASVAWRSFSSTSICASVSFALAIYIRRQRQRSKDKFVFFPNESRLENGFKRRGLGTHGCGFERLDGLDVRADVVRDGLKVAQDLLRFVDDGFVLQNGAVVR